MFVNMVLEDVEEFEITPEGTKVSAGCRSGVSEACASRLAR